MPQKVQQKTQKVQEIRKNPNFRVIWGDNIGINNLSYLFHHYKALKAMAATGTGGSAAKAGSA